MTHIRPATQSDIAAIEGLLLASGLTTAGAGESLANFFVAEDDATLVGVGGLEACGEGIGLLRSFAVSPDYRSRGIAKRLCERLFDHARRSGLASLYLLTTTAQGYFARLGFTPLARSEAPAAIRDTRQFRSLCPDSAVLMHRPVEAGLSEDPGNGSRRLFDAGYYCAEAVLLAVARHNGIESPLIPAIATGFCSGLARTSGMCGALAGGVLGLNLVYGRDRELESVEQNYAVVQRLVSAFAEACGSTRCSELLGCDLGTPEGQRSFGENGLHARCREFSATATRIAVALSAPARGESSTA